MPTCRKRQAVSERKARQALLGDGLRSPIQFVLYKTEDCMPTCRKRQAVSERKARQALLGDGLRSPILFVFNE